MLVVVPVVRRALSSVVSVVVVLALILVSNLPLPCVVGFASTTAHPSCESWLVSSSSSSSLCRRRRRPFAVVPVSSSSSFSTTSTFVSMSSSSSSDTESSSPSIPTFQSLPSQQLYRFRGQVAQGYGRGGKQLGVPTANLPASQFAVALQDIPTGVYFGWASVDTTTTTTTTTTAVVVHPAVVNVGYSPTFQGKENKEKIIEAHLIVVNKEKEDDTTTTTTTLPDFYDETMRLTLSGYLRNEQSFDSFPELIAQIHQDISDARYILTHVKPYCDLNQDPFLMIEKGNDDSTTDTTKTTTGYYEFVDIQGVLKEIEDASSSSSPS